MFRLNRELIKSHVVVWENWKDMVGDPLPRDFMRIAVISAAGALRGKIMCDIGNHSVSVEDELADCAMGLLTAIGPDAKIDVENSTALTLDGLCFATSMLLMNVDMITNPLPMQMRDALYTIAAWPGIELEARLRKKINVVNTKVVLKYMGAEGG